MKLKLRMWLTIIQAVLGSIATILLIIYVDKIKLSIYIYSYIVFLIYLWNFFWGGLSKLIVNGIYAVIIILSNMAYPKYFLGIAIAGAFLIIANPLKPLQYFIARSVKSEVQISLSSLALKKNKVFWEYRKLMKQHFHLDAYAKLYQNKLYSFFRKAIPFVLYLVATFLAIYSLNEPRHLENFNFMQQIFNIKYYAYTLFVIISITCIFIFGYIIYVKGFKSGFRFLTLLIMPLITFTISLLRNIIFKDDISLYRFILSGLSITSIVIVILQITFYYERVIYKHYHYFDIERREEIFANALYEPLIFDKGYAKVGVYNMVIPKHLFQEKFNKIINYANRKFFIITSYVFKDNCVTIYTAFKNNETKKPRNFLKFLSKIYHCNLITINTFLDEEKMFYPKVFYKNENYIIARTLKEAKELRKLGFYKPIYLSFFFKFANNKDLVNYAKGQTISIYKINNTEEIVETRLQVQNDETILEVTARKILLDALIYNAEYLKVSIRYELNVKTHKKYFNE